MAKIKLELAFFANYFDPNELTKLIGVQPTNFWFKGDELPSLKNVAYTRLNKPTRKETHWGYATKYSETSDIDDLAEPLLNIFEPCADKVAKFVKENNLEAKLYVVAEWNINESTPALGASKRLIQFLSKIGGWIDEDLYPQL